MYYPQQHQRPPSPEPQRFSRYENRLWSEAAGRKEFEIGGKVMNVDSGYYRSSQGVLKILEIVLSFLAILLVSSSYGVFGERSLALSVSFAAFFSAFMILVAKILTLHLHCSHMAWFLTKDILVFRIHL
ncbi:hypothetical protein L596_008070 [Steinernema carpocapsae]|uniref:MARVEL domain-containing protein n=1 Tax=Steinernema carpocapsae TaxID=34508 RepID=A0A4U5PBB9_STECR|nr:hypothetical protein L596_008070 [Steinernema carpocapsae]